MIKKLKCQKTPLSFLNLTLDEIRYKINNDRINTTILFNSFDLESTFKYTKEKQNLESIFKEILYLVYNMLISDDIEQPMINDDGEPRGGYMFKTNGGDSLSIFHTHICDGVLIWYLILNENNITELKLEYHKPHQTQKEYKYDIQRIYNTPNTYHIDYGFMENLQSLLNEKKIYNYSEFIKTTL